MSNLKTEIDTNKKQKTQSTPTRKDNCKIQHPIIEDKIKNVKKPPKLEQNNKNYDFNTHVKLSMHE